jgi:ABC-type polysaccharide/polyol phosphate transport system ATPase subunit
VKTVPVQYSLQSAAFGLEDKVREFYAAQRQKRELGPVVIQVNHLDKRFRIPLRTASGLTERALRRRRFRELHALQGVSFDVRRGEFFGIVGRNGSGKSTLLKILASIYRADRGDIRMAGRLAPFIELGVGFNLELTARENVALNGVMMGLSRREAEHRLDAVLDFAGLHDFVDLKLKNYSSGMLVRLAFAVMVQADADIMLIDEVLAVGDAAFAQRCMDVFQQKREAGKTLVLVTHDMATVQSFCDRAMLLHDGKQLYTGDPEEAVLRYFRLNFGGAGDAPDPGGDVELKLIDVWFANQAGERIESAAHGEDFSLHVVAEAQRELDGPSFRFEFLNVDGVPVFGFGEELGTGAIAAGRRVRISARVDNRLVPGRYSVRGSIFRERTPGGVVMRNVPLLDFVVKGTDPDPGMVSVQTDLVASVER